jgi:hypothetical protein
LRCKKQIISISRISNNPKEKRGKQMNENENKNDIFVKKTVVESDAGEKTASSDQGVKRTNGSSVYEKTFVGKTGEGNMKARKLVYYLLGIIEILLACRFVLRLLGANPGNAFVKFIYSASNIFLWPFSGIFRSAVTTGIETESVMEPATIIAVIIYALAAWGIVKLIAILKNSNIPKS